MLGLGRLHPSHNYSDAYAVNNFGQVVGESSSGIDSQCFLWSAATGMFGLGRINELASCSAEDINDSSWVVGYNGRAFLWTPQDGMRPLGGEGGIAGPPVYGSAQAINELGQVAGLYSAGNTYEMFYWDAQIGMTLCGRLTPASSADSTRAYDINNRGQIVGVEGGNGSYCATIWDAEHGVRDLSTLVDPCYSFLPPGIQWFYGATAINDAGWITIVRGGRGAVLIPYIPGDLDEDGDCDLQDLAYLLANFARTGDATYANGDLDCDADVDLQDLGILLGNFGETLP
ncbi:MAG: hypothetical protein HZB38_12385 [Planctomycetes bacterium]|nr:hypothetical protein [Planctomycetota bacterium]